VCVILMFIAVLLPSPKASKMKWPGYCRC